MSAADSAWIRVLVIEVGNEPEPLALADGVPDQLEPAGREILGDQPGPRVQKRAAETDSRVVLEHLGDARLPGRTFMIVIEHEKWRRAIARRRRRKCCDK